jgi:hypothetical protein
MTPVRIQRQRIKGWTMPPNTVYVGRPSKLANPFRIGDYHWISSTGGEWGVAFSPGHDGFVLSPDRETVTRLFREMYAALWDCCMGPGHGLQTLGYGVSRFVSTKSTSTLSSSKGMQHDPHSTSAK